MAFNFLCIQNNFNSNVINNPDKAGNVKLSSKPFKSKPSTKAVINPTPNEKTINEKLPL